MNVQLNLKKDLFNAAYAMYLFDYSNRYNIYYGSAASGKSVFITQKLLIKLLNEKRKLLVVRKVANSLRDSCWQLFIDVLNKWQLYKMCKTNISTFTIELPNGSLILFKGLDDREKLKSITGITDIWIEEATEILEDDFSQLDLRLRANQNNLQIYLSFNPVSKVNWVYKKWFSPSTVIGEGTFILKTTYKDNKFLPDDYIKTLEDMKESNPTYYKIYVLGEFCSLDKLVYNNWTIDDFNYRDIEGSLLIGLDFGFVNDLTALVASILDERNKRIYVFDEWCALGKTNEEIADVIKNKGFAKSIIIADSAEQKSIEEIKRLGVTRIRPSVKGKGSINQGIQKLQQYNIIVHSQCRQVITELQNYSWKKNNTTGEYINAAEDKWNHTLDALRYSLQCVENHKTIGTMSKTFLGL